MPRRPSPRARTGAHRLTRLRLPERGREVAGDSHRTQRPVTDLAPGAVSLEVVFTPPAGLALDERDGPATRLHVAAMAASCDHAVDGAEVAFPACHVHQQDWGVPVRLVPGAGVRLELVLHG